MLDTLLTIALTTLILATISCYAILRAAVPERPFRRFLLFVVLLTPFAAVVGIVKALSGRQKTLRYSTELGRIEDEIETERAKLFGGRTLFQSFSESWKTSYLYALQKSAAAAAKLDPGLDQSVCCAISNIR
jgi:hypothetical protein